MPVIVIHENRDWLAPFSEANDAEGVPWEGWFLDGGTLDLDAVPPDGVFWSRMSASSHTGGHVRAKDHTRSVLSWLEAHGKRVVNGRRVTYDVNTNTNYNTDVELGAPRSGPVEIARFLGSLLEDRVARSAAA